MPALAEPQTPADVRIEEVEFVSHGAKLSGSLVLPRNGQIRAAVVFIHGSGRQPRNMTWAGRFASEGIAALVYDKRGVGKSGGDYEGERSVSEKKHFPVGRRYGISWPPWRVIHHSRAYRSG
jgi:cephalosporin-C deacetylase-like acetyl esterase